MNVIENMSGQWTRIQAKIMSRMSCASERRIIPESQTPGYRKLDGKELLSY